MSSHRKNVILTILVQAYLVTIAHAQQEPSPLPIFAGPENFKAKKLERPSELNRLPDPIPVRPRETPGAKGTPTPRVARKPRESAEPLRGTVKRVLPQISIQTTAPQAVDFGKTLPYGITVNNRGTSTADHVVVQVKVSDEVKITGSIPQAVALADGQIQFELGSMPPRSEKKLSLYVISESPGTINLSAQVKFATTAQRSIAVRQPQLTVERLGPQEMIYGVESTQKISVTNSGDAAAHNVRIRCNLPKDVKLLNSGDWSGQIGTLAPGQSRQLLLSTVAQRTGSLDLEFFATADLVDEVSTSQTVQVLRPMLKVESSGPEVNYLNRPGVYTITIRNPGDAAVENIQIENRLSDGLRAAAVEKAAMYKKSTRTLFWKLNSLPAGQQESIRLRVDSIAEGHQQQQITVRADHGLTAETEHRTDVISRADISMSISDAAGPIEVGGTVEYEITVRNRGTRDGDDVEVRVVLPESMKAIESGEYQTNHDQVIFPPFTVAAGVETVLRVKAVSHEAGDLIVRAVLRSDALSREIIKEENTYFFRQRQRMATKP